MADINIVQEHHLAPEQARAAAQQVADKLAEQFELACRWDGDVLRFERPGVTGTLTVGPTELHLSVALGLLLKAMKASIEQAVRHELDAMLAASPGHAGGSGSAPGTPGTKPGADG